MREKGSRSVSHARGLFISDDCPSKLNLSDTNIPAGIRGTRNIRRHCTSGGCSIHPATLVSSRDLLVTIFPFPETWARHALVNFLNRLLHFTVIKISYSQ